MIELEAFALRTGFAGAPAVRHCNHSMSKRSPCFKAFSKRLVTFKKKINLQIFKTP